ncbi:MAG: glycosyltransferase family 4 protein [Terriglobales bacterium]
MTKLASHPLPNQTVLSAEVPGVPNAHGSQSVTAVIVDASCFSLPYDYSLCDALGQQGHRVVLARSEFRASQWKRPASGFEVWSHFYHRSNRAQPGPMSRAVGKMGKAAEHMVDMRKFVHRLRELRPDAIHFQWLPAPLLDRLYLQELSAIAPLVLTVHNTDPHGTVIQRIHQKLGWASVFRHFQAVIVHSEFSRRQILEKNWISAEKVHVIPHGVLNYYCAFDPDESAKQSSSHVVMFFGCVEPYKGLDVLIRAFALLPADLRRQTQLLVAGTPNMDARPLRQQARDLGIESQVLWRLHYIAEEEVPRLFRSATVVVLPYHSIDQSGVLMTAVAFGKAIVASGIGGIPEVIQDGVHGILVNPGDPDGLAAALRDVLTDPDRRRSMERATTHLASTKLSWETSAHKTADVYRQISAVAAGGKIGPAVPTK